METITYLFQELYRNFNNRQIDLVIAQMTKDVKWANGMDGGYVYGHDGVKEYWSRQFKMVHAQVTPIKIDPEDHQVKIKVHQVVYDLNGSLLSDELVLHYFYLTNGKISAFEIEKKADS
jgi:ketosteroid isomerase-like protein